MSTSQITRRVLLTGLPSGVMLSELGPIRWALAQDGGAFRRELQASTAIANSLANEVRQVRGDIAPTRAETWQGRDYQGRRRLATNAVGFSQVQLKAYVPGELLATADAMVERSVPLIPEPREIIPLSTARMSVGDNCPPAGEVMWDILFDSLGLLDERQFLRAFLNEINGVPERVGRINDSIRAGRWERGIDAVVELLEFLLDGGAIVVLLRELGERLGRRFLRSIALRLVPFVGTGYAIVAFGLAFHRHRDRLFCDSVGRDSKN